MTKYECDKHPGFFGEGDLQTGDFVPCRLCRAELYRRVNLLEKRVAKLEQVASGSRAIVEDPK